MRIAKDVNLYQWDTNQKFIDVAGTSVDFVINNEVYRVYNSNGVRIPDEVLQVAGQFTCYENYPDGTVRAWQYEVEARPMRPDYAYTPTQKETFEGLVEKVNTVTDELMRKAARGDFDGKDYVITPADYQAIADRVDTSALGDRVTVVEEAAVTLDQRVNTLDNETLDIYQKLEGKQDELTKPEFDAKVRDALANNTAQLSDSDQLKIETWLGLDQNYLTYYNQTPYQVTGDYNPAHKKFVEDYVATHGGGSAVDQVARDGVAQVKDTLNEVTEIVDNIYNIDNIQIGKAWNGSTNPDRAILPFLSDANVNWNVSVFNQLFILRFLRIDANNSIIGNTSISASNEPKTLTFTTEPGTVRVVLQFEKNSISINDFDGLECLITNGEVRHTAIDEVARSIIKDEIKPELNNINNKVNHKDYYNKKILFLGDSITALDITSRGWVGKFNDIVKPSVSMNVAVAGAHWCDYPNTVLDGNPVLNGPDHNANNTISNQVEKVSRNKEAQMSGFDDFDFIIIACGTNDTNTADGLDTQFFINNVAVEFDDLDRQTWSGAMRYAYERLKGLYPNAKVFYCSPIQAYETTRSYTDIKTKRDRIETICLRISDVAFIDTFRCGVCGVYEHSNANGRDLIDGLHPNINGAGKIGRFNANEFINKYLAN